MWVLAAAALLVVASAVCLKQPPADRKVLTYKGQSYRFPLGAGVWASPQPIAHIILYLLTEELGYDVEFKWPYFSSQSLLTTIAGCPTQGNCDAAAKSAGRFKDPPDLWAAAEVWTTSTEEQRLMEYCSSAGPVGYVSTPSLNMYKRVHQAGEAAGEFLGFWRSLYRPQMTGLFSDVGSMHSAILGLVVPPGFQSFFNCAYNCNVTGLVRPGTNNGVPPDSSQVALWASESVTLDGGWYYAPACASNKSTCVPVVLGDSAWNFLEWCLVAKEQSLPLALTFVGWFGEQTVVNGLFPLNYSFLFYWWRPDNSFLTYYPEMTFFKEDILRIRQFQYNRKVIWAGLRDVDEDLVYFLSRAAVTDDDMSQIMWSYNGSNAQTLACDWLRTHESVWQTWLPAVTNCLQGFYYNATMSKCRACPPGSISVERGVTACTLCPVGFYAPEAASTGCEPCAAGKFVHWAGSRQCDFCPRGTYKSSSGPGACLQCAAGGVLTTADIASVSRSACECPRDYYQPISGEDCRPCGVGLVCSMGSKEANIPHDPGAPPGLGKFPRVQRGYYTTLAEPLSIYECAQQSHCPGGLPNTCAGGRSGINCAFCLFGTLPKEDGCQNCSSGRIALTAFTMIICLFVFPPMIYHGANSRMSNVTTTFLGLTVAVGMIVTTLQILGTYHRLSLPWPEKIASTFKGFSFLLFNGDTIGIQCILGNEPVPSYLGRFFAIFVALGFFIVCYLLSKVVGIFRPGRQWHMNQCLNSVGAFLQVAFIAIVGTAVTPLPCQTNPNGKKTSIHFPQVQCFKDQDHITLTILGVLLMVTVVLPFLTVSIYAAVITPKMTHQCGGGSTTVIRFRYLLYRFRPDVWWWGIVFNVRQMFLAFSPLIQPNDPNVQLIFVICVLTVYLVAVSHLWPWKTEEMNMLEGSSIVLLIMVVVNVGSFMEPTRWDLEHEAVMWCFIGLILSVNIGMVLFALGSLVFFGPKGLFGFRYPRCKTFKQFATEWCNLCAYCQDYDVPQIVEWLKQMNNFDRKTIDMAMGIAQCYALGDTRAIISGNIPRRVTLDASGEAQDLDTQLSLRKSMTSASHLTCQASCQLMRGGSFCGPSEMSQAGGNTTEEQDSEAASSEPCGQISC